MKGFVSSEDEAHQKGPVKRMGTVNLRDMPAFRRVKDKRI